MHVEYYFLYQKSFASIFDSQYVYYVSNKLMSIDQTYLVFTRGDLCKNAFENALKSLTVLLDTSGAFDKESNDS